MKQLLCSILFLLNIGISEGCSLFQQIPQSPITQGINGPTSISFSPDNKYIAIANRNNSTVTIYNNGSFTPATTLGSSQGISLPVAVAFSPNNLYMAVANITTVTIYNTVSFTLNTTLGGGQGVSNPISVAFSNDNNYLAVGNNGSQTVTIYNTGSFALSNTLNQGVGGFPISIAFSYDNNYMAVANRDASTVKIYNNGSFTLNNTLSQSSPTAIAFSHDNLYMAVTNQANSIVNIYNNGSFTTATSLGSGQGISNPGSLAFSNDNKYMAVGNLGNNTVTVYNNGSFNILATLLSGSISVAFSPDNKYIAFANQGSSTVSIYSINAPCVSLTGNSSICQGQTGNNLFFSYATGGQCPYTYTWTGPNNSSGSGQVIPATDAGTYYATVIDGTGNTGFANLALTVNSLPSFTLSPTSPINVCSGSTKTISTSLIGSYTYQWKNPSGTVISTASSMTAGASGATTSGSYSVTVTDVNNCSSTQCFTININPLPTVNLTTDSANNSYCAGSTINIFAEPTLGAEPITYSWTGPKGAFITTGPLLTIPNSDTSDSGTYTANFTDNNGCTGTASINVTVNNLPSFTVTSQQISPTEIQLFTNIGSGNYSFSWTGPNFTSTQQNPILNTSTASSGIYTVTVTNLNTNCSASGSIALDIESPASIAIIPTNLTVCQGSPISLTVDEIAGVAPFTFSWSGPNGYTNNTPTVFISNSTLQNSGIYTLTVTDANNSTATATATVIVNALPTVDLTISGSADVVAGSTVTLIATPTRGKSPFTLNWYKNNALIHTDLNVTGETKLNVVVDRSAEYSVVIIDSNGCQSDPLDPTSFIFIDVICNQKCQNGSSIHKAVATKYCNSNC